MRLLLFFGLAINCFASIWDVALDFNAPNNLNASSVFSYGVGGTPGTFATLGTGDLDCIGGTTYCYNNGASFPNASYAIWNGSGSTITYSVVQPVTFVNMDPQTTAGTIVRFTAPWTDVYAVNGSFEALNTSHHPTTGEIWTNNTNAFAPVTIGAYGDNHPFNLTGISLSAGDTIDFIVKSPTLDCCYLGTGLAGTISSATGGPAVPEPGTFSLLGGALLTTIGLRIRAARRA
jgi:hypothetical protein